MNPNSPLTPREELEIRITALLMGQLPPDEAAAVQAQIDADPELTALHARLRHAIELLREARALPEHPAPTTPLVLSKGRRERLLATFRGIKPLPSPTTLLEPKRRDWKWMVPMSLAASAMFIVGASLFLPSFSNARRLHTDNRFSLYNNAEPTAAAPTAPSGWASQGGAIRALKDDDSKRDYYRYGEPSKPSTPGAGESLSAGQRPSSLYLPKTPTAGSEKVLALSAPSQSYFTAGGTRGASPASRHVAGFVAQDKNLPTTESDPAAKAQWAFSQGRGVNEDVSSKLTPHLYAEMEDAPAKSSTPRAAGDALADMPTSVPAGPPQDTLAARAKGVPTLPIPAPITTAPLSFASAAVAKPQPASEPAPSPVMLGEITVSAPLSTAGKVNLEQKLAPFSTGEGRVEKQLAEAPVSGEIAATTERELLRRVQREDSGKDALKRGRAALQSKDSEAAFTHYKNASESIVDAPATKASREEAVRGLSEAGVKLAEERVAQGNFANGADALKEVLRQDPDSVKAKKLLANIEAPQIFNKKMTPEFRAKVATAKPNQNFGRIDPETGPPSVDRFNKEQELEEVARDGTMSVNGSIADVKASTDFGLNGGAIAAPNGKPASRESDEFYALGGIPARPSKQDGKKDAGLDVLSDYYTGGNLAGNGTSSAAGGGGAAISNVTEGTALAFDIDLDLAPQVVEFEGFINYGSPISPTSKDANGRETVNIITPSVINAPIFATRKLTTNSPVDEAGRSDKRGTSPAISAEATDARRFDWADSAGVPSAPKATALKDLGQSFAFDLSAATKLDRLDTLDSTAEEKSLQQWDGFVITDGEQKAKREGKANNDEPALGGLLTATGAGTLKLPGVLSGKVGAVTKLAAKAEPQLEALAKSEGAKPAATSQPQAAVPAEPAPVPQPEVSTKDNAFSTFSLNVSDVSFKLAAASLEKGTMPEPATVRSEEFINALDYRDPEPAAGAPLAFASERARYPFAHNRDLLRLSVKTAAAGRQAGRPLNLTLLIDNSGSMERDDRVRILKESLRVLAKQLQPQDKLSVITFSRTPRLWADGVSGDKAGELSERVSELTPQGGTDLGAAMDLGYTTALKHYQVGSVNRVVLLTDGAANLGNVSASALKGKVETHRKQGVAFDCFGVGWEGYNDDLLEQLSRNGDGRYGFINTPEAASTEFAAQLAGALRVAASDVKVQVEFNPRRVTAYRQLGYAKHQLKKEQFRDNTVDAAEIGAAEAGNALYAIEVNPRGTGDIATVRVRFKVPGTSDYREHEWTVPFQNPAPAIEQSSSSLRLAATASAFSELLAQSPFAAEVTTDRLLGMLNGIPAIYGADPRPSKLEWMLRQAKSISGR